MRLPKFRLRTLMIAVAVVAALLGRWVNFRNRAHYHRQERERVLVSDLEFYLACTAAQGDPESRPERARAAAGPLIDFTNYHDAMSEKYDEAFRRPWLLVLNDPPAPPLPSDEYQKVFRAEHLDFVKDLDLIPGDPAGNARPGMGSLPTNSL